MNKVVKIVYGKSFPFDPPEISFNLDQSADFKDCFCLFDLSKLVLYDIIKEDYHPTFTFVKLTERAFKFLEENTVNKREMMYKLSWSQNLANQIAEISKTKLLVISAIINFVVILVSTPYFIRNDDVISTFLESKL